MREGASPDDARAAPSDFRAREGRPIAWRRLPSLKLKPCGAARICLGEAPRGEPLVKPSPTDEVREAPRAGGATSSIVEDLLGIVASAVSDTHYSRGLFRR